MEYNTHPRKSVCETEDVTLLWIQRVYNDSKVTANRQAILIKNKNKKHAY